MQRQKLCAYAASICMRMRSGKHLCAYARSLDRRRHIILLSYSPDILPSSCICDTMLDIRYGVKHAESGHTQRATSVVVVVHDELLV